MAIYQAGVYSAHQMGSCRLSANPKDGPLRETGETWECDGLFVADASVFPTSLGINPMITVEAVAYMVADQVSASHACFKRFDYLLFLNFVCRFGRVILVKSRRVVAANAIDSI